MKGSRQRVRGVIDDLSRPSNASPDGEDSDEETRSINPGTTFMISGASAQSFRGDTFVVDSTAPRASTTQAPARVTSSAGGSATTSVSVTSKTSHAARHTPPVPRATSATAVGSMSLTAALHNKPHAKSRPNTTGASGKLQGP